MAPTLRFLFAAAVVALALAPFWAGRADLRLLMEALSFLALAQMWNLLAGLLTLLLAIGLYLTARGQPVVLKRA